jgi:hypothetical protein
MLCTGHIVLAQGGLLEELRQEARGWLAQPSYPSEATTIRARYAAATKYEDATDIADDDPAAATMLMSQGVAAMLELWCRTRVGSVPRGKDLLSRVAELDPVLGLLARRVFSDASFVERQAAAAEVADRTISTRGFFEWDSGPLAIAGPSAPAA